MLVGRKVLRKRWPSGSSIDSRSLRSVSSEATLGTLSVTSSLDYAPTPIGTLERKKNKHLQTVPEEGRSFASSVQDSLQFDDASICSVTPKPKRSFNLFRRFRSVDERHTRRASFSSTNSRESNATDSILIRSQSIDDKPVIDLYEPYAVYEVDEPRKLKKQNRSASKTSLQSTGRSPEGRLLIARGSIVHPVGVFGETTQDADPASSYATMLDPTSGRPRLIRRDSVIHPPTNENGEELAALHRKNSIVRPLALEDTENFEQPKLFKRYSLTHSYGIGVDSKKMMEDNVLSRNDSALRSTESPTVSDIGADTFNEHLPGPFVVDGRFENPFNTWHKPGILGAIKWKLTSKNNSSIPSESVLNRRLPIKTPSFDDRSPSKGIRVTWLGHSTVLVQMDGINILTDPMFSDRASMVQFMGPKRYRPPPCTVLDLPRIDAVLISHNHYDHLDVHSVELLNGRFGPDLRWFVPLGLKEWMEQMNCADVIELSWWEEDKIPRIADVRVIFTPAQHWCKRAANDDNKVLWGSWCVLGPKHRFFFAGDTGYCNVFKLIGKQYGPFHLAAIPIGAYEPRWFMQPQHVDPDEAVCIHEDVQAIQSIGIHWGTFSLAHEHYLDPPKKLHEALSRKALPPHTFFTVHHGQTKLVAG